MKKIILSLILCFILILPSFSATTISTSQLNKQGWEYIKKEDYYSAFNSFSSIFEVAKEQQDYAYIMYGFLEMIKNDNLPATFRFELCQMLVEEDFEAKLTNNKLRNLNFAITFKMMNIIAKTDSKDKLFTKKLKSNKQIELQETREIYSNAIKKTTTLYDAAYARLIYALYEYSIGNSKLALGQIQNESNNILKYGTKQESNNCIEIVNFVLDLCK